MESLRFPEGREDPSPDTGEPNSSLFAPHWPALLLVGPTGSGKTPLGEELAQRGLTGRRALHFDFGAQIRRSVRFPPPDLFSQEEVSFLQDVLATGALLEDEHFPLALKILRWFISEVGLQAGEWLILNGLPRHRGQAQAMAGYVRVATVVELCCPAEVVIQRIQSNAGGDRAGRLDDHLPLVERKLEIYHSRTRPLIDFYKELGTPIIHLHVGPTTTAVELATSLEAQLQQLVGEADNIGQTLQISPPSLMNKSPLGN